MKVRQRDRLTGGILLRGGLSRAGDPAVAEPRRGRDVRAHQGAGDPPPLEAAGAAQMAIDDGLLDEATSVTMRRYRWTPPAVSLGKYQRLPAAAARVLTGAGMQVVRRPSGGRAVLHGQGFEWSFAVAFPAHRLPFGPQTAYGLVSDAFAAALAAAGVALDVSREGCYERSALCFASPLRHDLLVGGEKIVAVAQARRGGCVLVHGSVLERRPPLELTAALEEALGETWRGEGLVGAGCEVESEALWRAVTARLSASLRAPVGEAETAA